MLLFDAFMHLQLISQLCFYFKVLYYSHVFIDEKQARYFLSKQAKYLYQCVNFSFAQLAFVYFRFGFRGKRIASLCPVGPILRLSLSCHLHTLIFNFSTSQTKENKTYCMPWSQSQAMYLSPFLSVSLFLKITLVCLFNVIYLGQRR